MGTGILVCGCNGSGKSTLGRALADRLGFRFLDIEDYFFPDKNADYLYEFARSGEEVERLLLADIQECGNFVLASVKGNFRREITAFFDHVLLMSVPREIRVQRIYERSFRKFGKRMLPGGDLFEKEERFLKAASERTEAEIEEWLHTIDCRVLRIDGTKAISENLEYITKNQGIAK